MYRGGVYKDGLGVAYKDGISVVYKTLNSISKKAYHVFLGECVVYKTLNYEICSNAKTLNSKIFGIFFKIRGHHVFVGECVVYKTLNSKINKLRP